MQFVRLSIGRRSVEITICLEPLPAPEANYLLTLSEAVSLMERLDHPAAKTIFDVKSASSEGVPLPELVERFAPYIAHVHANDANRRGPGFGETDFRPVLAALDRVGYGGWVSVEVFDYSPDPQTIATESLGYLEVVHAPLTKVELLCQAFGAGLVERDEIGPARTPFRRERLNRHGENRFQPSA